MLVEIVEEVKFIQLEKKVISIHLEQLKQVKFMKS
jgi:hypothetical protein